MPSKKQQKGQGSLIFLLVSCTTLSFIEIMSRSVLIKSNSYLKKQTQKLSAISESEDKGTETIHNHPNFLRVIFITLFTFSKS